MTCHLSLLVIIQMAELDLYDCIDLCIPLEIVPIFRINWDIFWKKLNLPMTFPSVCVGCLLKNCNFCIEWFKTLYGRWSN